MRVPRAVRRTLRRAAGTAARLLPRPDDTNRRVILCYHSVHPSLPYASAAPAMFAEHLDWLASCCEVVGLQQIVEDHTPRPDVRVAVTFDDGYADNYEHAFPLLAERNLPATFFVTVGFLERDPSVVARLHAIWEMPDARFAPLWWSQVREMRDSGMRFGSHTWSHPNLAATPTVLIEEELRRSKDVLEQRLGAPVDDLAYPFGKPRHHVDRDTLAIAEAVGYRRGYVSLPRAVRAGDHPLRIPRIGVGPDTVASLAAKVQGGIDWHAAIHERLPRRVDAVLFPPVAHDSPRLQNGGQPARGEPTRPAES